MKWMETKWNVSPYDFLIEKTAFLIFLKLCYLLSRAPEDNELTGYLVFVYGLSWYNKLSLGSHDGDGCFQTT